jgi:hypothetical protein
MDEDVAFHHTHVCVYYIAQETWGGMQYDENHRFATNIRKQATSISYYTAFDRGGIANSLYWTGLL